MINNPKNDLWVERYRPQKIGDLVLQDHVRAELEKFIKNKSIPHLLLLGGAGVGKTTIAKILLQELDCDKLELNASSERGIDVIRNRVMSFAMTNTMRKWKIVFLDEMDLLTFDAQAALRNIFETYSEYVRFICTGNYSNKIISAIKSRCQCLEFEHLDKKTIAKMLVGIMDKEKVTYDVDELLILIDDHYPDIRSMINSLQLDSLNGKFKYNRSSSLKDAALLLDRVKGGNLSDIRKMNIDYVEAMKFLFDRVDELTTNYDKRVQISLHIAEYLYRDGFISDREINFAACALVIMEQLGIKAK